MKILSWKAVCFLSIVALFGSSCSTEDTITYEASGEDTITYEASGTIDGHDYVDLGLSVKWATCNLGAQNPWEIGEHYAWGYTTPYTEWTYANYSFSFAPCNKKYELDAQYDAVTANWGESWRMPTKEEIDELLDNNKCDWVWVDNVNDTGISGYNVKSKKNGNSIFLPAGKYTPHENYLTITDICGHYWSSTADPSIDKHPSDQAPWTIYFKNGIHYESIKKCYDGLNIRGVVGTPNHYFPKPEDCPIDNNETERQGATVSGKLGNHTYVDLGLPSRTLWATYNVGASMPHEYGEYYAWGEVSPKDLYNQETYKYFLGYSESGPYHYAQYSKYIWFNGHGTPDYKLSLDPEDDAATVNWGSQWQMPSKEQIEELAKYCKWYSKNLTVNGKKVYGWIGESKINGYKIYLARADWKYNNVPLSYMNVWYWSRDLSGDTSADGTDYWAWYMIIKSQDNIMEAKETDRVQGLPVRPVVKQ